MIRWLVLCLFLAYPFGNSFAASFNCAKASSASEKMICASPELSQMDEYHGKLYKQVIAKGYEVSRIKKDAKTAWKKREAECTDNACLNHWYRTRIGTLNSELLMPATCTAADSGTQMGMNRCAAEKVRLATDVMNQYYQHILELSSGRSYMQTLIENSQANWISFSKNHCDAYQDRWSVGGSMGPFMYQRCLLELVNNRTQELWKSFIVEPGSGKPETTMREPYPLFSSR